MVAKIKKGDRVIVITGRDKGKKGEVLKVLPKENRAVVSGVNTMKRHTKQSQRQQGGIVNKDLPINLSNLAHIDPKSGDATKIGAWLKAVGPNPGVVGVMYTTWQDQYRDLEAFAGKLGK